MIQLVSPADGHVTQAFGARQLQDGQPHAGQDYAYYSGGKVCDAVYAAADGVVLFAGDSRDLGWPNIMYLNPDFDRSDAQDSSAGNYIIIQHHVAGKPVALTGYGHLEDYSVRAGSVVKAGQRIGTIGETGFSAGKHLHFDFLLYPLSYAAPLYGRTDPNPYMNGTIGTLSADAIITQLEEAGVSLSHEDKVFIQQVVHEDADRAINDNRAQSAWILEELSKKIADSTYEVKVFTQQVDNENTDRAILDNRAEEQATRAAGQ
jgi:hypothetical protein